TESDLSTPSSQKQLPPRRVIKTDQEIPQYNQLPSHERATYSGSISDEVVDSRRNDLGMNQDATYENGIYEDEIYEEEGYTVVPSGLLRRKLLGGLGGGMSSMRSGILPSYSGEIIIDDEMMIPGKMSQCDRGCTSGNCLHSGTICDTSPAMASFYTVSPIIKPFGTGALDNLTFSGGATAFRDAMDGGFDGNFGFTESVNIAFPLHLDSCISFQGGVRANQTHLYGDSIYGKRARQQYFATAGVFKRDLSYPIQGGVAFDWYQDNFFNNIQLHQARCEISVRTFSNCEYGFMGGVGTSKNSKSALINLRETILTGPLEPGKNYVVQPQDYYAIFFRKHGSGGNLMEARIGATSNGDIILGGSGEFAMNEYVAMHGGFSTLIPKEGQSQSSWRKESWEISVGLKIYFRGGGCSKTDNQCRPMFDVANVGSFFNRILVK
ncbi:MAG: DUF6666 family protein, partial [Thermoguttaceae bacterium]